jgi:2-octaprenyl-6-methoxyphenol hydroxylase
VKENALKIIRDDEVDCLIVGGGLVGATLALALAERYRVIILESQPRYQAEEKIPGGERAIVLSASSKNILTALGVWSVLEPFAEVVSEVQVSDRGHFGKVNIRAQEEDLPALGYVIQAKNLQFQLSKKLDQQQNIQVFYQAHCSSLQAENESAVIRFESGSEKREVRAKLVIGADGHHSILREKLGISVSTVNYEQSAIVSNISLSRSHQQIAYERFTSTGPIAMLPLSEHCSTLIWTVPQTEVNNILGLSDEEFVEILQENFGYRLGRFLEATPPVAFPIIMQRSVELVRSRFVLVGNAANAIHPIAGQGLNLGLRDAAVLAELLSLRGFTRMDALLREYVKRRRADHLQIVNITHSLVGFFTNDFFPLTIARNLGMVAMDIMPPVKRWLSKRSLGQLGYITPLACGVSMKEQ